MKNYIILISESSLELEGYVNDHIKKGYEPIGGISVCNNYWPSKHSELVNEILDEDHLHFSQAMILK